MATMFKRGHKFDIMDLFCISTSEVQELFMKELDNSNPDLENIQTFLDSGLVDVNMKGYNGHTPLHVAARRNYLDVAELLISSGAEVNARTSEGRTPLHVAASWNSQAVAELLISSGAEVNARTNRGYTPLHRAARWNYLAVAELLISSGAEVNTKDYDGWTPYDCSDKRTKVSKLLKPKK